MIFLSVGNQTKPKKVEFNLDNNPLDTKPLPGFNANALGHHSNPLDAKPLPGFKSNPLDAKPLGRPLSGFHGNPLDSKPLPGFHSNPLDTKPLQGVNGSQLDYKPLPGLLSNPLAAKPGKLGELKPLPETQANQGTKKKKKTKLGKLKALGPMKPMPGPNPEYMRTMIQWGNQEDNNNLHQQFDFKGEYEHGEREENIQEMMNDLDRTNAELAHIQALQHNFYG